MLDVISKEFKNKEITSKAVFSKCFKFRYSITNKFNSGRGRLLFILLNPSTATEKVYDPTLLRCKKRAINSCVYQFRVCNLFAYRATKPKELQKVSDPIGPYNNEILKNSIKWSDKIICSWGRFGILKERNLEVIQLIKKYKTPSFHLGLTKNNQPKHLLYISYNKILTKWF